MIAVPHNLESLCYTGVDLQSGKSSFEWFYEDIKRLNLCDAVFCISKEVTWLLQIYGINAHYLPYYPPKAVEAYLLNIRKKRQERIPNKLPKFLVLGSAINLPTRYGMNEVLEYLGSHEKLPFEVHVAGYKTEEKLKQIVHPQIVYHGTLSKELLEQQLVEADALVNNQAATSGALTRIIEHLIAGIPVIASFGAARDYFQSKDVHVFYSMDELMALLKVFQSQETEMPKRNQDAEQLFVTELRKMV
jgi:glycosyltransferase involved in cell wall biosynthesis